MNQWAFCIWIHLTHFLFTKVAAWDMPVHKGKALQSYRTFQQTQRTTTRIFLKDSSWRCLLPSCLTFMGDGPMVVPSHTDSCGGYLKQKMLIRTTVLKQRHILCYVEKKHSKCMQYLNAGLNSGLLIWSENTYTKETNKASSRNSLLLTWDMISTISIDHSFCSRNSVSTRIQNFLHIIPILKKTSDWKSCSSTRSTYSWLKCGLHILLFWDVTHFIQISSQRQTYCKEVPSNQGTSLFQRRL